MNKINFQRRGPRSAKERKNIARGVQAWHKSEGRSGEERNNTARNLAIGATAVGLLGAGALALKKGKTSLVNPPRKPITDPSRLLPAKASQARVKTPFFQWPGGKKRKRGQILPGVRKGQVPPVTIQEPSPGFVSPGKRIVRLTPEQQDKLKGIDRSDYFKSLPKMRKILNLKRYTKGSINFNRKVEVSSYTTRDGRRVGPSRRQISARKREEKLKKGASFGYAIGLAAAVGTVALVGRNRLRKSGKLNAFKPNKSTPSLDNIRSRLESNLKGVPSRSNMSYKKLWGKHSRDKFSNIPKNIVGRLKHETKELPRYITNSTKDDSAWPAALFGSGLVGATTGSIIGRDIVKTKLERDEKRNK